MARTPVTDTSGGRILDFTWPDAMSPNARSATVKSLMDWMSPSGVGSWNVPPMCALSSAFPRIGTGPMGETSVEVDEDVRRLRAEVVVEAERHQGPLDVRVRQRHPHVLEAQAVLTDGHVRRELGLGEAEEALARAVLGRAVVDAEGGRLRREVAVELERSEGAGEGGTWISRMSQPTYELGWTPRSRMQGGEVDVGDVEAGLLELHPPGQGFEHDVRRA